MILADSYNGEIDRWPGRAGLCERNDQTDENREKAETDLRGGYGLRDWPDRLADPPA